MDVVRNHIKIALVEAIAHIFKYSLPEIKFLKIEGVIAVTADADVFIVHVDQDYDLNRDKADTSDANDVNLDREILIKSEPPSSPTEREINSETAKNDPSIVALLEHFQTIKKENHIIENIVPSSFLSGKSHPREPHSESFYEDGSWNVEESSVEDEQTLNQHGGNFLAQLVKNRSPCKRLVRKRARRTSLMEPLRQNDGVGRDNFIITESSHICAYPNCYKRFKLRRDLLRHQTKKHGRIPVRRRKKNADAALEEEEPLYVEADGEGCDLEFVPDDVGDEFAEPSISVEDPI